MNFKKSNIARGFTLVELLVVIAIISILATLLLLQLGSARAKARDVKRIADINQVRSAIEQYFDQNGFYPATEALGSLLAPTYLTNLPVDPLAGACAAGYSGAVVGAAQCYGYAWSAATNPTKYHIWAELEQPNKNALSADTDINSTGWSGATAVGTAEACTSTANDCIFDLGQSQ